jgi:hypothetical protein
VKYDLSGYLGSTLYILFKRIENLVTNFLKTTLKPGPE